MESSRICDVIFSIKLEIKFTVELRGEAVVFQNLKRK